MIKLNLIIQKIKQNKIVAIPTDTIFGFSCLPNFTNIRRLAILKRRNVNKGFILLTSDLKYLKPYISEEYLNLLALEYQKIVTPTTFIVPSLDNKTLAIRLTKNTLIQQICDKTNSAIISSSCNISEKNNIKTILKLRLFFGKIYFIAPNKIAKPSIIIDLITKKIIRK